MKKNQLLLVIGLLSAPLNGVECLDEDACGRFNFAGELLYWKPHISGLELDAGNNYMTQTTSGGVTTTNMDEYDVDPHFQWNAGYRLSATYGFACSDWDTGLIWTHFQGSGTRHVYEDASTDNITKSRVKLDQVDLILSYKAEMCTGVNLKPIIGLRWAKIHEGIDALLVTDITYTPSTTATSTRSLDDSQNYHGIGPVFGLWGDMDLGCGFGVYGSAVVGLLYGDYRVTFRDSTVSTAPISTSYFSVDKRHLHTFDWNVDLAIGIVWETELCDCYPLAFNLGFEHHQYFNQSHLGVDRGDLTFDGGVFGVNISL